MKNKVYDLWVFNDLSDIKQVNVFHGTFEDTRKLRAELNHKGAWLYNLYNEKYKYSIITDSTQPFTIQEKVSRKIGEIKPLNHMKTNVII